MVSTIRTREIAPHIAIIPIGSQSYHGPHLPLDTATRIVEPTLSLPDLSH